jgi:hypothetical protein
LPPTLAGSSNRKDDNIFDRFSAQGCIRMRLAGAAALVTDLDAREQHDLAGAATVGAGGFRGFNHWFSHFCVLRSASW